MEQDLISGQSSPLDFTEDSTAPKRYRSLRRKIFRVMILLTIVPISILSLFYYWYYQRGLSATVKHPLAMPGVLSTVGIELLLVYLIILLLIVVTVFKLSADLVARIRGADLKREQAFRELEHSQKLSSIGRLAAGVAHEINNPLMIINESAGLMTDLLDYKPDGSGNGGSAEEIAPEMMPEFRQLTRSIADSVDRCREVTHRLLGFARRLEPQVGKVDLNEVLESVVGFLKGEALQRNIAIHYQFADNLPSITSDRGQLQQVFLNILINAFAAVEKGGNIDLESREEYNGTVAVAIQDDGSGMSAETLDHIFEPFFTTKKEYGTGLGLPITYGIVKRLGGTITVDSKENEGTIFTVYLPLKV